MRNKCIALLAALAAWAPLSADGIDWLHGKIDTGPTYLKLKIKDDMGAKAFDMNGGQLATTWVIWKGAAIKTNSLFASGGNGRLQSHSVCGGWYIPVTNWLAVMPNAGFGWSKMKATGTMLGMPGQRVSNITSPQAGLDVYLTFWDRLRVCGSASWAWSKSKGMIYNEIYDLPVAQKKSQGVMTGLMLDYMLSENWSVNVAGAFNHSFGKGNNELTGFGGRIGVGYRF